MKGIVAVALALPLAVGTGAWALRASRIHPQAPIPKAKAPPPPPVVVSLETPEVAEPLEEKVPPSSGRFARRESYERLLADYSRRIEELIDSIDWTRAESRVRFPAEHGRLREEFDRAVKTLDDGDPLDGGKDPAEE